MESISSRLAALRGAPSSLLRQPKRSEAASSRVDETKKKSKSKMEDEPSLAAEMSMMAENQPRTPSGIVAPTPSPTPTRVPLVEKTDPGLDARLQGLESTLRTFMKTAEAQKPKSNPQGIE